jgi:hypothetical protein
LFGWLNVGGGQFVLCVGETMIATTAAAIINSPQSFSPIGDPSPPPPAASPPTIIFLYPLPSILCLSSLPSAFHWVVVNFAYGRRQRIAVVGKGEGGNCHSHLLLLLHNLWVLLVKLDGFGQHIH